MKKKLLPLALALVLCLGLIVPAAAAGATFTEIISPDVWDSFDWHSGSGMEGFHDGISWRGASTYGAFDKDGNVIVQPYTYSDVTAFFNGMAWGKRDGMWCAIDKTGKELFTLSANTYRIINNVGGQSGQCNFYDGLAKVYSNETKAYGFVDKSGSLVIPCEYKSVGEFHDGLAKVYDEANAYWGYIDKTGKLALPFQYTKVNDFSNGIALVQLGQRQMYIDKTGKEVLPQYPDKFMVLNSPETGTLFAVPKSDGHFLVNRAGKTVSGVYTNNRYNSSEKFTFYDGMMKVKQGNKWGYVNESGVLVIPCQYDSNYSFSDFLDGYAVVRDWNNGRSIIIDKTGRVTATFQGRSLSNAGNGYFKISSDESGKTRYGFIDYTGKEIVPCKYKEVGDFSGGVAAVKDFADKWGFVNTTGAEIVPCKLSRVWYTDEPGIFIVIGYNNDGKRSIIKSSGWTAPVASKFTDVKTGDYFAAPVQWAVEKNITTGTTATTFSPKDNCTHGQILTFLWRAAGSPASNATLPFATTGNEYYLGAVKWAYEKGMIDKNFNHKTPCTRADAVNYIWQAFGKATASYDGRFTDIPANSPYATAVAWALANGVTTGATTTTFNPSGICNRGQIVTFLHRAYSK